MRARRKPRPNPTHRRPRLYRARPLAWLVCALAWLAAPGALAGSFAADSPVKWRPWGKAAFEEAAKADKLVLVNVGMEGCTACNRMERLTYREPAIAALINARFVPIAADAQAQPDVGERFSDWGWPATAFLKPDGTQVFAMAGNKLPQNFMPILKDLLQKQAAGTLAVDPHRPYAAPPLPTGAPTALAVLRDDVESQVDRYFHPAVGGWYRWGLNAEASGGRVLNRLLRLDDARGSDKAGEAALRRVAEMYLAALDPVWGGAYEGAIHEDGTHVPGSFARLGAIPEKRISSQANALLALAAAYTRTGDAAYARGLASVHHYLDTWMRSPEGTWYANQKDTPPHLAKGMSVIDYWLLSSDAARRAYGVPPVDHAVYTDKNGEVITAYLAAYRATGESVYRARAEAAADALLKTRQTPAGWFVQTAASPALHGDDRVHPHRVLSRPYLRTQAHMGLALLALYQVSNAPRWLRAAEALAQAMATTLSDGAHGFWATSASETDAFFQRRKPLEDNAVAARFLAALGALTHDETKLERARTTLRAVAAPMLVRREGKAVGQLATALRYVTAPVVEYTVVTASPADPRAAALHTAALKAAPVRAVVHTEAPGRYPDLGRPVVFVCTPQRCSQPAKTPADVARIARTF